MGGTAGWGLNKSEDEAGVDTPVLVYLLFLPTFGMLYTSVSVMLYTMSNLRIQVPHVAVGACVQMESHTRSITGLNGLCSHASRFQSETLIAEIDLYIHS